MPFEFNCNCLCYCGCIDDDISRAQSELDALRAENAALKDARQWIPVGEYSGGRSHDLPPAGIDVEVLCQDGNQRLTHWLGDDSEEWQCEEEALFWRPKGGEI